MYIFAVCDDEAAFSHSISSLIQDRFREMHVPVSVYSFTDPAELLKRMDEGQQYDVLFIDIDMPGMDGIEFARRLRAQGDDALLIFVSNKEELVFQTFDVQPFRFIRKRYIDREIDDIFRDVTGELERRSEKWIRFADEAQDTLFSVPVGQVVYVEARGKSCFIHMTHRDEEVKIRFRKMTGLLEPYGFIQVHRSYYVNPRFIYRISADTVELDDGTSVPLSRRRREAVKEEYFRWSMGK